MSKQQVSRIKRTPAGIGVTSRLAIIGGKIVNDDQMFYSDIYIEDGVIKKVAVNLGNLPYDTKVIDVKGKMVLPGGIDPNTHMESSFMGTTTADDFHSGTKAALAGGTTMIIDFVNAPELSPVAAFKAWQAKAGQKACCDYGLHVAITTFDEFNTEREMAFLVKKEGVNSFQAFMCGDNLQMRDNILIKFFNACTKIGALAIVHAENGDMIAYNQKKLLQQEATGPESHQRSRPECLEAEATNRAIILADQVDCPLYILHIMSKSAADLIASYKHKGVRVFGETIAAAIGTDGRHYFDKSWTHAAGYVMAPPLNPDPSTPNHLINLLSSGALQVVGSDHCTFNKDQKAAGMHDFTKIPNGVNGVEDRMSVLWTKAVMEGFMDPCQFVGVTSTNAAKIFNIYPRKGRIQVGSDADVVVWDPKGTKIISAKTHHQAVDFNIFEGMEVTGLPVYVISQGKVVVDNGRVQVRQGAGQFIPMEPYSYQAYSTCQFKKKRAPVIVDRSLLDKYSSREGSRGGSPASTTETSLKVFPPTPRLPNDPDFEIKSEECAGSSTKSDWSNLHGITSNLSGAHIHDSEDSSNVIRMNNPPRHRSTRILKHQRDKI